MLQSSQDLVLAGKTVLVTRPEGQHSTFSESLQALGATVLEMPALAIVPPSSWDAVDAAIACLAEYDWLILASANGVEYFLRRCQQLGQHLGDFTQLKVAVVGKKTAHSLQQFGIKPALIPANFVADALVAELCQREAIAGQRILFPRVESGGREVLVQELTAQGAIVTEIAAYQSGCPDRMTPEAWAAIQAQSIDIVTFTSSKTVHCFWQLLTAQGGSRSNLQGITIASIGPQTSETCRSVLGRVDIEAEEFTLEGLSRAIIQWAMAQADHK